MTQGCMKGHDFKEGIRAVLVDKDGSPKWDPATVDEVSDEVIDEYFHDLGEFDLNLQNNEDEQ